MQFTDIKFVVLFPIACIIYFLLPKKLRKIWLLTLNILFIFSWGENSVRVILFEVVLSYFAALLKDKIDNKRIGKAVLFLGFISILGYFLYCKYFNFALETYDSIAHKEFIARSIIAPVGISFYSLQILGYLVDVWKGKARAEKNFINYACFVTFFPLFISGPIERSQNLLNQIDNTTETAYSYDRVREGLLYMLWGFFLKMVIADRASTLVATVYDNYLTYKGLPLIVGAVMFSFQLYADFAGYSFTAYGASKILGYNIILNFNNPYFAPTVSQFWRRWHISLSTWLRDYIYIPLGGSRCTKARKYFNLAVTFLVSGLWHGASWTYVAWGGIHAVFQIAGDALKPVGEKINVSLKVNTDRFSYKFARALRTFILVDIAWVFFRSSTFEQAWYIISNSFPVENFGMVFNGELYTLGLDQRNMNVLLISLFILLLCSIASETKKKPAIIWIGEQGVIFRYLFYWVLVTLIVISMNTSSAEFLYMQF